MIYIFVFYYFIFDWVVSKFFNGMRVLVINLVIENSGYGVNGSFLGNVGLMVFWLIVICFGFFVSLCLVCGMSMFLFLWLVGVGKGK